MFSGLFSNDGDAVFQRLLIENLFDVNICQIDRKLLTLRGFKFNVFIKERLKCEQTFVHIVKIDIMLNFIDQ